jgi:F0F1-type ATP synthase assembly protein I
MKQLNNQERKPLHDKENFLARANERFQERATNAVPSALAGYTLVGAIIVFTLIGYGIDRWRGGSSHLFLILGLVVGIVVGFSDLAKFVWKR